MKKILLLVFVLSITLAHAENCPTGTYTHRKAIDFLQENKDHDPWCRQIRYSGGGLSPCYQCTRGTNQGGFSGPLGGGNKGILNLKSIKK